TIGHSLTLLVFTINDLNAFSKPIEISIALTIIITGFHAIKPIFYGKELLLTFIFGLIHGSAFGITLNEWGLTQSQKLLSLFGFNIGIEIMQVLIVLVCLPMVFLSNYPIFKFIRWIIASLTIFISIFWVVERVTNKPNVVTQFIESLF
ncbi:MAG: HupE/UreJ family protein, partial [Saprospiraceae bacterium]